MTVIATLVSRDCIVHASDSLITERRRNGVAHPLDWRATKLVGVPRARGMLAYYGFAGWSGNWTTLAWLRSMARIAPVAPEEFAVMLAAGLEAELFQLGVHRKPEFGVGIHFAAYERVGGYWVPELFHITNWLDPSYGALRPNGVGWSRDSFTTLSPDAKRRGPKSERLAVNRALLNGRFLQFNNGDPLLFNSVAGALHQMVGQLDARGALRRMGLEGWRSLARLPIEVVSRVAGDFVRPELRVVGGRTRDLAVTQAGQFSSTSGDAG